MSTLLLLILFAFMALAIWLGYAGYRSMQKKSGPVPPTEQQEGARPAGEAQTKPAEREGAQPARHEGAQPARETVPVRPEDEGGPKRADANTGAGRPESHANAKRSESEAKRPNSPNRTSSNARRSSESKNR